MDKSIFPDKDIKPTNNSLEEYLRESYNLWNTLRDYVFEMYPAAKEEWNYPGKKYGWSFRIKDKKRAIIYFIPSDGYFKVAFVFGQKATDQVLISSVSDDIKSELENARVYAEGRGIRIDLLDNSKLPDIKKLVEIKLAN